MKKKKSFFFIHGYVKKLYIHNIANYIKFAHSGNRKNAIILLEG